MTPGIFQRVRQFVREGLKTSRGMLLALALGTLAVHAVVLGGSFKTMDDETCIVYNEKIRHISSLKGALTESFFGTATYYRPLVTLSFMLEYQLAGLKPWVYYLTNVLLHLGNVILLFFIFDVLLKKKRLVFAAALLFAVHPLHWEAVANIAGRSILLSAFGQLASFWFYLRYVQEGRRRDYALALVAFVAALLSKESAVVLPAVLTGYEFWLAPSKAKLYTGLASRPACRTGRHPQTVLPKEAGPVESRWDLYGAGARLVWFWVFLLAYLVLRNVLHITNIFAWPSPGLMFFGIATFLRGVLMYLRLFVFPVGLHFDRATPYFTHFADFELWGTLCAAVIAVWALQRCRRQLSRRARFFMFWAAVSLLPVAQLFPLPAHLGYAATAEHFLYVALAGLAALTVLVAGYWLRRARRRKVVSGAVARFCVAGFYAYLMLIAVGQNLHAVYELSMFEKSLAHNPRNTRVRLSYGLALAKVGLFAQAEEEFRKVLAVEPWDTRARIGLAKSLCDQGKCLEAISEYEVIPDAGSLQGLLENNLKVTYDAVIAQYRDRLAREERKENLRSEPQNSRLHYSLGVVYAKAGKFRHAMAEYREAIRLDARNRYALYNLGSLTETEGRPQKAVAYFKRVIAFGRAEDELTEYAYRHLSGIYERRGESRRAKAYGQKAEKIAAQKTDEDIVQ